MPANVKVVIPCLNEGMRIAQNLRVIREQARLAEGVSVSLLLVNDGSTDQTYDALTDLLEEFGEELEVLSFTHNFGKEAAIYAGLQHSAGADAVVVMDADLEHPPELLPEMINAWQQGHLVVEAVRRDQLQRSGMRGLGATAFYQLMRKLAAIDLTRETDYKLLDCRVIEQLLRFPERERFFKGLIKWIDQPAYTIPFAGTAQPAASSWSFLRLLRYGLNALTSFTSLPLHAVTAVGLLVFITSLAFMSRSLYMKMVGESVDGFTTVIGLQALFASAIMFSLGIIGSYLAKIYEEVKARPVYIINSEKTHLKPTKNPEKT